MSGTARRIYRSAAILSMALFFVRIAAHMSRGVPETVLPALKLLLLAGVFGTAITMVGMEYFLFGFDNSSALKKMFWFCVMLLPPLGPALYCFIVYSRSSVLEVAMAKRTNEVLLRE